MLDTSKIPTPFCNSISPDPLIPMQPEKIMDFERLNMNYTLTDFAPGCERVLASDIGDIVEPTNFVVVGKIIRVQEDQLWYYVACYKCHRRVDETTLPTTFTLEDCKNWDCGKCNTPRAGCEYRYKIQIRVRDRSGSVSLCLMNRDSAKMLGCSAYELFKSLPANVDVDIFPEEMNDLVGRLCAFAVSVAQYNLDNSYRVYTVSKVSEEETLLSNFPAELETAEENTSSSSDVAIVEPLVVSPSASTATLTSKCRSSEASIGPNNVAGSVKKKLLIPNLEK